MSSEGSVTHGANTRDRLIDVSPDELRRRIDEALAEIEELEADLLELFTNVFGPAVTRRVVAYIEALESEPRIAPLKQDAPPERVDEHTGRDRDDQPVEVGRRRCR